MAIKFIDKYPGETIRALSWKQPYASMMLHGKVETRTWITKYLGWVLICASQTPYSKEKAYSISGETHYMRIVDALKNDTTGSINGKAIAIGYLYSSIIMGSFQKPENISSSSFVEYNPDLYCHFYKDVQPIVPFDWKGTQGWKTLDQETKEKIILL